AGSRHTGRAAIDNGAPPDHLPEQVGRCGPKSRLLTRIPRSPGGEALISGSQGRILGDGSCTNRGRRQPRAEEETTAPARRWAGGKARPLEMDEPKRCDQ